MTTKIKLSKNEKLTKNILIAVKKLKKGWTIGMEDKYSSIWIQEGEIGKGGKAEPLKEEILSKLYGDSIIEEKGSSETIKTFVFSDSNGIGQAYLDKEKADKLAIKESKEKQAKKIVKTTVGKKKKMQ